MSEKNLRNIMLVQKKSLVAMSYLAALSILVSSCESGQPPSTGSTGSPGTTSNSNASGKVNVDGSSTVFPVSEAMAEEFKKANAGIDVSVGESGTGGGFKKFCAGEISVTGASRAIEAEEIANCEKGKIEFVEIPIAYDALSVVVNPENTAVKCLKVDELKKTWAPEAQGKVTNWKQINPAFPDLKLDLYGAGTDSGTFDYFTKVIVGKEKSSRTDYTASEDDNTLVQGVAGEKGGMGYFGYAYYEQNKDKLKAVEIDSGKGCVAPGAQTVLNGTYNPLSRPIFVYVSKKDLERPEVKSFVDFYVDAKNQQFIADTGYVPLPSELATQVQTRYKGNKTGSIYVNAPKGATLKDLLSKAK
jgi:phosphate transport system substrate-binding protein